MTNAPRRNDPRRRALKLPRMRRSVARLLIEIAILAVRFAMFLPSLARSYNQKFWNTMVYAYHERAVYCESFTSPDDQASRAFQRLAARYRARKRACRWGGATNPDLEMAIYNAIVIDELSLFERQEKVNPERLRGDWWRRIDWSWWP